MSEPLALVGSRPAQRAGVLRRVDRVVRARVGWPVVPLEFLTAAWAFAPDEVVGVEGELYGASSSYLRILVVQ